MAQYPAENSTEEQKYYEILSFRKFHSTGDFNKMQLF